MKDPLVTISIPSFNSAKTIEKCLAGIKKQGYKNTEILIIDGGRDDGTVEIAKKYEAKHKFFTGQLLAARYEGVKNAKGKYTLIFDSDQILARDAIASAVKMAGAQNLDMLVFEEDVYKKNTFVEKLFALDRKLINKVNDLSPLTGTIMPRFFRTDFLQKAYANIPEKYFTDTGGPDHAIVYYEATLLGGKIGTVKNAVKHLEPSTFWALFRKFYRWGYTSAAIRKGKYSTLMQEKERFRTGIFTRGLILESLGSIALLILKGLAFKAGGFAARLKEK